LGAALLLSGAVVALNTVAATGVPPAQVATALHEAMRPYTSRSRMNIAFGYVLQDQQPGGWSLQAAGAGAGAPLIRRASGAVAWLETAGFPLGTFAAARYHEVYADLAPGDMLLLLSDGIVAAMSQRRELFGFERLEQVVAGLDPDADAHAALTAVLEAVRHRSGAAQPHDDITVVVRALAGSASPRSSSQ